MADVNECAVENGGCAQVCTNTEGSFQCSCIAGYALAADNLNCNGMYRISFVSFMNCIYIYISSPLAMYLIMEGVLKYALLYQRVIQNF